MSIQERDGRVDVQSLEHHLSKALDCAENESAKYHLREAYQKAMILEER
ncbi:MULTISPECIES: hypothetical protein [Salinibaculum]